MVRSREKHLDLVDQTVPSADETERHSPPVSSGVSFPYLLVLVVLVGSIHIDVEEPRVSTMRLRCPSFSPPGRGMYACRSMPAAPAPALVISERTALGEVGF